MRSGVSRWAVALRGHPRRSLLSPGNAVPMTNYQRDAKRWDGVKCAVLCQQNVSKGEQKCHDYIAQELVSDTD